MAYDGSAGGLGKGWIPNRNQDVRTRGVMTSSHITDSVTIDISCGRPPEW